MKPISSKQEEFLRTEHGRINLLSGSVRSGKTYISLIAWALFVGSMPANNEFIMVGKTVTALKRNCLNLLVDLIGSNNFKFNLSQKSASLFGRRVWLEGANDERSESKIRGMTLAGAYCDELTLFPQGFYMMLLSRLSVRGAQLYATTNPDVPTHWVKAEIIDNEKIQYQLDYWHFTLDDDDIGFNDPQYIIDLKVSNTGVFYDRYILGKWVKAEGLIYPMFDRRLHVVPTIPHPYEQYQISCDYGTLNPLSMGLWGLHQGIWYRVKEFYHDGRKDGQKTDDEYYTDLEKLVGNLKIKCIVIDPSAASFITLIRRRGKFTVRQADNAVLDGIRNTATALKQGIIKFNDCCEATFKEFEVYGWDEKALEDTPVKENDHAMDEIRYFVMTNKLAVPRRKSLLD